MRILRLLVLALLTMVAFNPVLLAESTVSIGWAGAGCSDSGTSAQCSFAATVADPDFPEFQDQISASGYVLSAANSLTFEFSYDFTLGNPNCVCFTGLLEQLFLDETGVLTENFRLSTPAPGPGYFAFYDIPGIGANGAGGSLGGNGSDGGMLVQTSGIFQPDGTTIAQPVSGDFLSITASFEQSARLAGSAELPIPLPPTTYSIELFGDICNPDTGDCILESFTRVPEPASLLLLLPIAGWMLRRPRTRYS